jgi:hypothetical protein
LPGSFGSWQWRQLPLRELTGDLHLLIDQTALNVFLYVGPYSGLIELLIYKIKGLVLSKMAGPRVIIIDMENLLP